MIKKKKKKKGYKWTFTSIGGQVRVKITSGEDIRHLGELDRKLWTALSCPVTGLEFDAKTLAALDSNGDGKIRRDEVVQASEWLCKVLKNPDNLLKEEDSLPLSEFNDQDPDGAKLLASAKQILSNLGLDKDSISIADTDDNTRIFAGTPFNGDGIVTALSAGDDDTLKALVADIAACIGSETDRCGEPGVTEAAIEEFYAECAAYVEWKKKAEDGKDAIFPYGDATASALASVEALQEKIADYFMRCKLVAFDPDAKGALDVSAEKIGLIAGETLSEKTGEIAGYPLFRPGAEGVLPLGAGVNPAWKGAFDKLVSEVVKVDYPDAEAITEEQWNAIVAKFAPYKEWCASKAGAKAEGLGLEKIQGILAGDKKAALLELVAKDKALEAEALSIESVGKLLHMYKYFFKFLNNYVSFVDFYDKAASLSAVFQAGRLFIDQRSTDLCVKVEDMGKHANMAELSGMFILYCTCTSKAKGTTMNIAAVLTDGDTGALKVGRNAVFYDRDGGDWDAVVTKIVENPISVREAFWSPYKKVGKWLSDKFGKNTEEKDSKALSSLTSSVDSATNVPAGGAAAAKPQPSSFDIAKFAGIFAAIGMAVAYLSTAIVSIVKGAVGLGIWKVILVILAIMLVISGPAMIMAYRKLRRRDLGPLLNANGWAINAVAYVRQKFGATLTSLAKYPKITAVDPKERRKAILRIIAWVVVGLLAAGAAFCYFTDRIPGHPFHKPQTEQVEGAAAPEGASTDPAPES